MPGGPLSTRRAKPLPSLGLEQLCILERGLERQGVARIFPRTGLFEAAARIVAGVLVL